MARVAILIRSDEIGVLKGEITGDKSPKTAEKIIEALPIEARGQTWGEEIYFRIPVRVGPENPQEVVEKGDLAYWPPGNAFCIFFGKTPASRGDEIRPASPVNVFGKVVGDLSSLGKFSSGSKIRIEKA